MFKKSSRKFRKRYILYSLPHLSVTKDCRSINFRIDVVKRQSRHGSFCVLGDNWLKNETWYLNK